MALAWATASAAGLGWDLGTLGDMDMVLSMTLSTTHIMAMDTVMDSITDRSLLSPEGKAKGKS